jgi:glycosyltransferase involved in cell wall biosynthesis
VFQARRTVGTIAELITAGGFDLVHSVMAWGHLYGGRAARRCRRPSVWYQHGSASWKSGLEAAAALVKTRAILANSRYTAEGQRRVNPRRARIEIVHPGTRLPDEDRAVRRGRGRAALGIGDDEFAVGIAARVHPWKGQDVVIRAAASLLHARRRARLFIIGDALFGLDQQYAASLPRLAESLGILSRVTFAGFRDDVADCLAALDVAVHASLGPEPFGLALIEAMAAGTALVASDGGAVREIIEPGATGIVTPPGDHEALATALLALCDDPEGRASMAEAGELTARERFDARLVARRIEDLYLELVG